MILTIFSWIIVLIYAFVIQGFYWSWRKIPVSKQSSSSLNKISIVIAIRNEEENIPALFQSIQKLDYPKNLFEVILIDDHSDDASLKLMEQFKSSNPEIDMSIQTLPESETGKKMALKQAYALANYEIIQCTDGDCILPISWLQECAEAFKNKEIKLISGGIKLYQESGLFQKIQALELLSLIASGGAAIGIHKPIMCNGANMAFRKEILEQLTEEAIKYQYASGDDVFLLQEVKRRFGPKAISFIKSTNYWLTTKAEREVSGWLNQRIRWVSKSSGYQDAFLLFTSLLVFLVNFNLLLLLIGSIFNPQLLSTLAYIFILKGVTDFIFLKQATKDSSQKHLLSYFIPLNLAYPFFISYTAILGQFKGFTWKGRDYKK